MKKILLIFSFLLVAWTAAFSQGTKIKLAQLQPCPDGQDCVIITGPNGVQEYHPVSDICTACADLNTDTFLSDVQMGTQDWVFYISNQDGDIVNTIMIPAPKWDTDVDTTGLKDFVLGCLPEDDLIDGLDFSQNGDIVTLTVTTSDGGIFTDNFSINLFDGSVDTTGLKDFVLDCIKPTTITSTDGSVDIMHTTNTDGSTNYDLNVDLFDIDTAGLKTLIQSCIPVDSDNVITDYDISQNGNTVTVTVTTSEGDVYTDSYNISLFDGTVDTTGLKSFILACIPDPVLFGNVDTTGLKQFVAQCASDNDDLIDDYEITQNGSTYTVTITTTDGQTFTDDFNINLLNGGVDTTGLKQLILDCTATTTITSTDGSVDLTTTTNADGSTNYDITVDVFGTDTTGLKAFVQACIDASPDNVINDYQINQDGNTVEVTITTADGQMYTDDFSISLFDGTVDTTGLKDFVLACIPDPVLFSNVDTTGLKDFVAQCAADNDDLINNYEITQNGSTYTVTIETTDGQTYTDDFTVNLLNGGVDTTGLKALIQSCAPAPILFDNVDTTGLKEFVEDCIPTDIDTVVTGVSVIEADSTVTITVTNSAGETFSDDFTINLLNGGVDTTGLKELIQNCIPASNSVISFEEFMSGDSTFVEVLVDGSPVDTFCTKIPSEVIEYNRITSPDNCTPDSIEVGGFRFQEGSLVGASSRGSETSTTTDVPVITKFNFVGENDKTSYDNEGAADANNYAQNVLRGAEINGCEYTDSVVVQDWQTTTRVNWKFGNDATGEVNRDDKPFATINAAYVAMNAEGILDTLHSMIVDAGYYDIDQIVHNKGEFLSIVSDGHVAINGRIIAITDLHISGEFELVNTDANRHAVFATGGSNVMLDIEYISSENLYTLSTGPDSFVNLHAKKARGTIAASTGSTVYSHIDESVDNGLTTVANFFSTVGARHYVYNSTAYNFTNSVDAHNFRAGAGSEMWVTTQEAWSEFGPSAAVFLEQGQGDTRLHLITGEYNSNSVFGVVEVLNLGTGTDRAVLEIHSSSVLKGYNSTNSVIGTGSNATLYREVYYLSDVVMSHAPNANLNQLVGTVTVSQLIL